MALTIRDVEKLYREGDPPKTSQGDRLLALFIDHNHADGHTYDEVLDVENIADSDFQQYDVTLRSSTDSDNFINKTLSGDTAVHTELEVDLDRPIDGGRTEYQP